MIERRMTSRPRVRVTKEIWFHLLSRVSEEEVSDFARQKGLPYLLVYNLVYGRVKSLSARDYRLIFGEEPPRQEPERIEGEYFRKMVQLYLFLHKDATKKELYRELFPGKRHGKVDYRIFTGEIQTVKASLEEMMERKFLDEGLSRPEIRQWIKEVEQDNDEERVSYQEAKPILDYLKEELGVGLKGILNQSVSRYESGQLRTISMKRYQRASDLKKRAEKVLRTSSRPERERFLEGIGGTRKGFTLFSVVEDQLEFMHRHARVGSKFYLGRSLGIYRKSRLKRIASWRAARIKEDGDRLINEKPHILVSSLPDLHRRKRVSELLRGLQSCLIRKMTEDHRGAFERMVLTPSSMENDQKMAYIGMDRAWSVLGMNKRTFDLMVGTWSDLFKTIARYDGKWHLPKMYVENLKNKREFQLVKAKYEQLIQGPNSSSSQEAKRRRKAQLGEEPSFSATGAAPDHQAEDTLLAPGLPLVDQILFTEKHARTFFL